MINKEKIAIPPMVKKVIDFVHSFFSDDTNYYAASLSFFTIFSIFPIIALLISIISMLPQFDSYLEIFVDYIFEILNPTHSEIFIVQAMNFINNSNKLGYIGIFYMLFVFTMFFKDYEYVVNKIHHAKRKSIYVSFFFYLGMVIILPIFFAIYILTLTLFDNIVFEIVVRTFYTWFVFFFLFKYTVNRKISIHAAAISSFLTLIALAVTKNLFVYYVVYNKTYTTIYGSLSTLLFFFLWIYVSWIIYLYGIKLCYKLNVRNIQINKKV